jgi:hypothetical protein
VADEEGQFFTFSMVPAGRELTLNVRTRRSGEVRVGLLTPGSIAGAYPLQPGDPPRPASHEGTQRYFNRSDISGRTVADCDPIFGDGLAMPVRWNGQTDIGAREGEPITLQFKLRSADLFGFEWT